MSLIVTPRGSEVGRYDYSKSAEIEGHIEHGLDLEPIAPQMSPEYLDENARRLSNGPIARSQSQVKVTSWLQQYNNDSVSGNRCIHAEDNVTISSKSTTPEMLPAATTDPKPAIELEDESVKRPSSADSTEPRQTARSSNEGQPSDSTATSVTPWDTPKADSICIAQETRLSRPKSPSGISDFSLNSSRYTPSIVSSILGQNPRRINPKKARLKNSINRSDCATSLARTRNQLGEPCSVATMGKRPVGYYGIGDYKGGFPPDVAQLASCARPTNASGQNSAVPARTDSKIQASLMIARRTSRSRLNASLPPHAETYELLTSADLRRNSTTTQELSRFACETPRSSGTFSQLGPTSTAKRFEGNMTPDGDKVLECAKVIPVPEYGILLKKGKRESLPISYCAAGPWIFGHYDQATRITTMSTTIDLHDHYVPLSDACPLLVGSLAMRQKLCVQDIDPEDPKVHDILNQHDIAIERVSKSDQMLLWHLAIHEASRSLLKTDPYEPFSSTMRWKGAEQTYSDVNLTLRIFLKWLKEKEQAHVKLYQRELKRLATRSAPDLVRWAGQRDTYDDQVISLSGALPLPHEPAAIWLNLYRLLRCRGISEEQLDREQVMTLMSKPRHQRRECLNTLALQCKSRTIDNADLDRRPRRDRSAAYAQKIPAIRIRRPSYSVEAQDQIFELPNVKSYVRRGRSGHRSYPVLCSDRRTYPAFGDSDWDTPLGKLSISNRDSLPTPLLSDIELPRNYVPPDRRSDREDELPPSRYVGGDRMSKDEVCALARRGSGMSRFSRSTTASERQGRTRWGRFKKAVRRCLPPCCCG